MEADSEAVTIEGKVDVADDRVEEKTACESLFVISSFKATLSMPVLQGSELCNVRFKLLLGI